MPPIRDITGQKFGRLTAIRYDHSRKYLHYWLFQCDCETLKVIAKGVVTAGLTRSCGCLRREYNNSEQHIRDITQHGMTHKREYASWQDAKYRCINPNNKGYPSYGGRGIRMCDKWLEDFDAFYAYMGPCPPKWTLDRIDVNGNYEPSNCRWASYTVQLQNTRRTKLSPEIVRDIRSSSLSNKELGKKHGAHAHTVKAAREFRTWKNIA